MKHSVCTISFRHQLISLKSIAQWAKRHEFDSIELWGVHGKNMQNFPDYNQQWLASQGLAVSMVSDYLPLDGDLGTSMVNTTEMCRLTCDWGAKKLRTFSGSKSSAQISAEERKAWTKRLRQHCEVAQDHGLKLVVETHPNTLADTLTSTLQLIEEVNHPALRINFDVIHVWEMGADPVMAFEKLQSLIVHLHLKNITGRDKLGVFSPANVYAPAGSREGMTSLFSGVYDFKNFLNVVMEKFNLPWRDMDASLEWFGENVFSTLDSDRKKVVAIEAAFNKTPINKSAVLEY